MSKILKIMRLLPLIMTAVKTVEAMIPVSGAGKDKLDAVLGIVEDTTGDVAEVLPMVTKIVARFVNLGNATGTFTTSAKE